MNPDDATSWAAGEPACDADDATAPDGDVQILSLAGRDYPVPREVAEAVMEHAQALHGHARALKAAQGHLERAAEAAHAHVSDRAQLHRLDEDLAAFESIDWEALQAEDPEQAAAIHERWREVQQVRDRFAWAIAHHEGEARMAQERAEAEKMVETGRVLARQIEGWSPELAQKLVEYAAAFGVTLDELREIADPRLWMILHRAHAGDTAARQRDVAERQSRAQAVRPAVVLAGGSAPAGAVRDDMAMRDWMRRRNDERRRG